MARHRSSTPLVLVLWVAAMGLRPQSAFQTIGSRCNLRGCVFRHSRPLDTQITRKGNPWNQGHSAVSDESNPSYGAAAGAAASSGAALLAAYGMGNSLIGVPVALATAALIAKSLPSIGENDRKPRRKREETTAWPYASIAPEQGRRTRKRRGGADNAKIDLFWGSAVAGARQEVKSDESSHWFPNFESPAKAQQADSFQWPFQHGHEAQAWQADGFQWPFQQGHEAQARQADGFQWPFQQGDEARWSGAKSDQGFSWPFGNNEASRREAQGTTVGAVIADLAKALGDSSHGAP